MNYKIIKNFGSYALRRKSYRRKGKSPKVNGVFVCVSMGVSVISIFDDVVFGDEVLNR
jgi:hypothetical protein